jgi:hypothetical protein
MAWTPIRTMRRGARPDFTLLREPPNDFVTRAQQWFMDQILDLEPGAEDLDGGRYAHKPGYHDTVAHNDARSGVGKDYSTRDPQDRRGPRDKSRAWDWTFRDAQAGNFADLAKYGDRLLAAYRADDPRLAGWREYLGRVSSPVTIGGVSTRRIGIDFRHRYLRIPDPSHDWHGHGSESTEHVESFLNKWALLTTLAGWTLAEWQQSIEEDTLNTPQNNALSNAWSVTEALHSGGNAPASTTRPAGPVWVVEQMKAQRVMLAELGAAVGAIASRVDVDPAELDAIRQAAREGATSAADDIVARVLAGLPEGTLTRDDVEQAVRDAFAGGLAPDTAS